MGANLAVSLFEPEKALKANSISRTFIPFSVENRTRQKLNNILRNVDTLQISWPCKLSKNQRKDVLQDYKVVYKKGFEYKQYNGQYKTENGAKVTITYRPYTWAKSSGLYFQLSVQKILLGNNFEEISPTTDIVRSLEKELFPVFMALQMDPLNLSSAFVRRIDFCMNFHVGSLLPHYIDFVRTRYYPKRRRGPYQNFDRVGKQSNNVDNGVSFASKTKHRVTSCYDKEEECRNPLSKGIFRIESQISTTRALRSVVGKRYLQRRVQACKTPGSFEENRLTLAELPSDIARKVVSKELRTLGLDGIIETEENFRELLKQNFSGRLVGPLMDFVQCDYQHPGLSAIKLSKIIGCSKATVTNYRKMLIEKGIAYSGRMKTNLPPLQVPPAQFELKLSLW